MTCRLCGTRVRDGEASSGRLCRRCDDRLWERAERVLERRTVPADEPNWEEHLRARASKWSDTYLGGF